MDMQSIGQQQPGMASNVPADQSITQGDQESQGGFTVNSDQIESSIKEQMDKQQVSNLDRVLDAGNELLFGKETHYQLMDQLQNSKDIGNDLGIGAFHVSTILLKESGNTIPGDVMIPSGVILIARASEFLNQSGLAQVTDDDFEEATHVFGTKMMDTFDPEYRQRMQQKIGGDTPDSGAATQNPDQAAQALPQSGGGLLNMTGRSA